MACFSRINMGDLKQSFKSSQVRAKARIFSTSLIRARGTRMKGTLLGLDDLKRKIIGKIEKNERFYSEHKERADVTFLHCVYALLRTLKHGNRNRNSKMKV